MQTCPCCGYRTLEDGNLNEYDICPLCWWENDYSQLENPDLSGGANAVSLRQAQENVRRIGVSDSVHRDSPREPVKKYIKDPAWKPL